MDVIPHSLSFPLTYFACQCSPPLSGCFAFPLTHLATDLWPNPMVSLHHWNLRLGNAMCCMAVAKHGLPFCVARPLPQVVRGHRAKGCVGVWMDWAWDGTRIGGTNTACIRSLGPVQQHGSSQSCAS